MSPPSDSDTLDTPTALLIKASVVNAGGHLQGEMTSLAQPGGNFWGFRLCGDVWDLLCCRNAPPHTKQALSFQRHPALPCRCRCCCRRRCLVPGLHNPLPDTTEDFQPA